MLKTFNVILAPLRPCRKSCRKLARMPPFVTSWTSNQLTPKEYTLHPLHTYQTLYTYFSQALDPSAQMFLCVQHLQCMCNIVRQEIDSVKSALAAVGFEPTPPKRLVP